MRSLWTSTTGMSAQNLNMDVIANNLANVSTTGFKKSRADFQDLLYQTLKAPGAATASGNHIPTGIQVGMGTRGVSVQKLFSQLEAFHHVTDFLTAGNVHFVYLRRFFHGFPDFHPRI